MTEEPLVHAGYQRYRAEMLDVGVRLHSEEPDTGWWQRFLLRLVGPLVPEGQL